jgi:hypothetical protein
MKEKIRKIVRHREERVKRLQGKRITNDNVEEHRAAILAHAKKFKYPLQRSTKDILIISTIVGAVFLILGSVWVWYEVYQQKSTNDLIYSITQIVPLQAAKVDGEEVRYSDYLLRARSVKNYLSKYDNEYIRTDDKESVLERKDRTELDTIEKYALSNKLARELGLSVSDKEVSDYVASVRGDVSEKVYEKTVLKDIFDWDLGEYKIFVHDKLLQQKVEFKIDSSAKTKAESLLKRINAAPDKNAEFDAVAKDQKLNESDAMNNAVEQDFSTAKDTTGIAPELIKMTNGKISTVLQGDDGYYIAKVNTIDGKKVNYVTIKIGLHELDSRFDALKKADKIKEYITIKEIKTT